MDVEQVKREMLENMERFLEQVAAVQEAWSQFMDHGQIPSPDLIRPEVLDSWKRSLDFGLDPRHIVPQPIRPSELNRRVQANHELIEATTPIFESFAEQFQNSLFTLDLYDKDLYFIKTYRATDDLIIRARGTYARPGLRRDECTCGTTAMSVAHRLRKPVRLIGAEHFDIGLHNLVCTSVPIFNWDNSLVGIINVVEHYLKNDPRTLETMIALSKGVEYNLRQLHNQQQLEITNLFNKAILESMNEAMIVVNSDGLVTMTNKAALTLINPPDGKFEGARVGELFGENNPFTKVLKTKHSMIDKEIVLTIGSSTKRYMGTIRPIAPDYTTVHGVIGTLKDMGTARNMMKTFGGWNASFTFDNIIGENPTLLQTVQLAQQTAALSSNTLIQGESGTGKEIFAHAIHNASSFRKGPFVAVNCAAIPIGLLESELFGYESGAYTGAKKNGQPGKFELAEGGTIFLDEINSMPLDIQAKMLRVVQDKRITRLGGSTSISLHLKLIAACNVNLGEMVSQGLFRSDLYYRLNVITIQIPPLRQRTEDLPLLSEYIIDRIRNSSGVDLSISDEALQLLSHYSWPGNVRELENVLERGFVQASIRASSVIETCDLNSFLALTGEAPHGIPIAAASAPLPGGADSSIKGSERQAIERALTTSGGNVSKAARSLGIARNTLYRKLKEYQIDLPR